MNCIIQTYQKARLLSYFKDPETNVFRINPFNANFTKWSNTLKQFVGNLPTNCLSVFDHFVGLALKGLTAFSISNQHFLVTQEIQQRFARGVLQSLLKYIRPWKSLELQNNALDFFISLFCMIIVIVSTLVLCSPCHNKPSCSYESSPCHNKPSCSYESIWITRERKKRL